MAEILRANALQIARRDGVRPKIVRALVRSNTKNRAAPPPGIELTTNPREIVGAADIDLVIEVMGGLNPARSLVKGALKAGQPVVTANKALIAAYGEELLNLSASRGVPLLFEAAVAGGIPIIRMLRDALASDRVEAIVAILNGTSNLVLDRLGGGSSYAAAIEEAQALGFAEADPSLDVGGGDAADKLAILCSLAFGMQLSPKHIPTQGIEGLTPKWSRTPSVWDSRSNPSPGRVAAKIAWM